MTEIRPLSLDHVALWVADPSVLASFLCDHMGMHVIERTDDFTLVGVDAREGKITLFRAQGPREAGVLDAVVLRVADLQAAAAGLPAEVELRRRGEVVTLDAPEGLRVGLVAGGGLDYDLDHVVLRVPDPARTAQGLEELGFDRRDGALAVADRHVRLERGAAEEGERPLLNHLAVLVESASELHRELEARGFEIDKVVDAENTLAVFVRGPDGIQVEYVEHKPGFSLT